MKLNRKYIIASLCFSIVLAGANQADALEVDAKNFEQGMKSFIKMNPNKGNPDHFFVVNIGPDHFVQASPAGDGIFNLEIWKGGNMIAQEQHTINKLESRMRTMLK